VLALRWLLGRLRAPRRIAYLLWAAVGFRLLCPVTVSSALSIFNRIAPAADATVSGGAGLSRVQLLPASSALPALTSEASLNGGASQTAPSPPDVMAVLPWIWAAGLCAFLLYAAVSYFRLRQKLASAAAVDDGVRVAGGIPTPFVLGLFRPTIYLPAGLDGADRAHILLHERTHLRRGDPWWKLLAFCLLAVYWWNPSVWLCWHFFCRDMEMSCDEAVLRALGPEVKQAYSLSLVRFAAGRRFPAAGPLAFGESGARSRVKNILGWKRARAGIVLLAASLAALLVIACCTNPPADSWVRVESRNGADVSFTCRLDESVRSWAIYEDVFRDGEQVSSSPRLAANAEAGKFTGQLHYVCDIAAGQGTFTGPLHLTYKDSFGTSASWETALPESAYTACGSALGSPDQVGKRMSLAGGEQTLLTVFFSDRADGAIRAYQKGDEIPAANALTVRFRLVTSSETSEHFTAGGADSEALARSLFALRNPYTGSAAADGRLLEALHVGDRLGDYTMALTTAEEPYKLQINFKADPGIGGYEQFDAEMNRSALCLLALIDNLGEVSWTYPYRTDLSGKNIREQRLNVEQADLLLASRGLENPDIKKLGQSAEGVQTLLQIAASSASAGSLTCEQVDAGAPYPASFGSLSQFAVSLPEGANYTLSAVTYLNGKSLGEKELAHGSAEELGGAFWLSCYMDEGSWDALHWTLYPGKKADAAVEQEVPLPGHAPSYSSRGFSCWGEQAEGTVSHISERTILAAVCAGDQSDAAAVPCETLTADPAALRTFETENSLAEVVCLTISGGDAGITA